MTRTWEAHYDAEEQANLGRWLDAIHDKMEYRDEIKGLRPLDDGNAIEVTMGLEWEYTYQQDGTTEWEYITDSGSLGGMATSADGDDDGIVLRSNETFAINVEDVYDPTLGTMPDQDNAEDIATIAARIDAEVKQRADGWNQEAESLERMLAELDTEPADTDE